VYVDDFLIRYQSKHIHIFEWHLQQCLSKLSHWADTNGFKFSSSKTVCIHFCRLHKLHPKPELFPNGTPIPVVKETKFLEIIFDSKLSFLPHIRHLKDICVKALNLLCVLGVAVDHRNKTKCIRLPNTASIFMAELYALLLNVRHV